MMMNFEQLENEVNVQVINTNGVTDYMNNFVWNSKQIKNFQNKSQFQVTDRNENFKENGKESMKRQKTH